MCAVSVSNNRAGFDPEEPEKIGWEEKVRAKPGLVPTMAPGFTLRHRRRRRRRHDFREVWLH